MRALIIDGQSLRLNLAHPDPVAGEGEAIVRLLRAGVSAIDVQICRGLRKYAGVLGHQFVGVVESVNPTVATGKSIGTTALVGKRVVGSPFASCGKCDMCMAGLSAHCRSRTIMGMLGGGGCLAERFAVAASTLAVVPDDFDDERAVFASEVAEALQTSNRLTIERKPFITVLGDGSLALLMAQVMAKLNASVRLVGSNIDGISICEKWGIKHRTIDEVGRRADQDIIVECTGRAELFRLATQMVRPRGTIVLSALGGTSEHVDHDLLIMNELQVMGSFVGGSTAEALRAMSRGEVDVVSLISRRMSLSDGPAIMKAASQTGMNKVLVGP